MSELGFRQLRYFVAIADAGAVARAANILHIAQSALSHHVSELEKHLGVKLLERRTRGVTLTVAGQRLYEHANAVLSSLTKAEEDVRAFTERAAGPVSLGLCYTAVAAVARDIMHAVRQQCPHVHLTLVEGLSPALSARVLSGGIDIALAYTPPKEARLHVEQLLEEDLYLVGNPRIIGASSEPVRFSLIPPRSVIGLAPMPASRAIIHKQFLRNQITESETLEIDSLTTLRMALEDGLGSAILARATVQQDLDLGRYHSRLIIEPNLTRVLTISTLSERPQTRAFLDVRKIVVEVVQKAVADGRWPARRVEPQMPADI